MLEARLYEFSARLGIATLADEVVYRAAMSFVVDSNGTHRSRWLAVDLGRCTYTRKQRCDDR
jgi:hypothetical protein